MGAPFLQDLNGNRAQIHQHRETLVHAIFAANHDPAAISREQMRKNAQQQRVISQLVAERHLLNDVQGDKLKALLLNRAIQPN